LRLPSNPLVSILVQVEKPGKLGAVVRTAVAAGVDAVVVADGRTDPFNPNVIRASRGTIFTTQLAVASTNEVINWLGTTDVQVTVARVDADRHYDQIDYRLGTAIVLGSEDSGVSAQWSSQQYQAVQIPMAGNADSLNVAVSAAILFYEARRQRTALLS
jgi:TrmH family RNA methyltransferase